MTNSYKSLEDLFTYAKAQARIEFIDYAGGRDSAKYWRQDKRRLDTDRKKCMDRYGWMKACNPLPIGQSGNGRLTVTADNIEYITGQYTATEIWGAVFDYLQRNFK